MKTKVLKWMFVCIIGLMILQTKSVRASVIDEELGVEDDIPTYEETIIESDITLTDKQILLNDETYRERYEKMASEGWILQDIEVENTDISIPQLGGAVTYGTNKTVKTNMGKVVYSSYVQATKRRTYYNNSKYRNAKAIQKYASFASNFIPYDWSWIASTLFSVDTSNLDAYFNKGYQRVEENATYYTKDAYYKNNNWYWIGYSVSRMDVHLSILSYYRDYKGISHQKTYSKSNVYKSRGYNLSDQYLISLAKKYYNGKYVQENISYPTYSGRYRLN